MKQNLVLVILILSIFALAFRDKSAPGHKYTVTLSQEEWGNLLQNMQNSAVMVRTSSYPGIQIAQVQDTSIRYQQIIQQQLMPQINADTLVKPKK